MTMLETRKIDDVIVVSLKNTARFNATISEPVREQLIEFFNKPNVNLAFDLKGINFIDSSGFGVFLSALKAASNNYGQFKICNVNGAVTELFKLLQLHHVFEIYDELDACVHSFKP
jgi:anti-sigma B factor antagonist